MKIIISSLYFHPDHSGIALYSSDFAFFAAEKGHDVHVITGFPFYPNWKKNKEDKWRLLKKESKNGVKIYRGYTFVPKKPSTIKRLIQEFGVLLFSIINYIRVGKADCIVVFTTPVSFGFLGAIFKKIYNSKLLINVQDFQVEAAHALNMVRGSFLIEMLKKIEHRSYMESNYVSSISESMCNILSEKVSNRDKILFWPNWIKVSDYELKAIPGKFRTNNNIPSNKIIVAYAGNIGLKQGLTILIDLAEKYQDSEEFYFLIIGEGAGLQKVKNYNTQKKLNNLDFLPFLDQNEYKDFLLDVDVVFISQQKTEQDIYFPSKLLGLMAAGKTILLSADKESELFKVLDNNSLALTSNYGDIDELCIRLEEIKRGNTVRSYFETKTRQFVKQFDREMVLNIILDKIV